MPYLAKDEVMPVLNLTQAQEDQIKLHANVVLYKEIAAKIKFLGEQLKPVKEYIEAAASKVPEGKIITEEFSVLLTLCQRENFSLKDAKAALGEEKLKPFMSTSVYTTLRVS